MMKMKENVKEFVICSSAHILDALKNIDCNKQGFLVVVDKDVVVGTLTDGDIRRAFINGFSIYEKVESICNKKYTSLHIDQSVADAIDTFKDNAIKFLPIVDSRGVLVNIITKRQLHSLLLQNITADLDYNFMGLNEDLIDHEIYQRPWGFYKTTVYNEYYQSKVISVKPKSQLSLQSHKYREEHWIVVHGYGRVQVGEQEFAVQCGTALFIPRGSKHRLINTHEIENLIITEVQIGDYLGEDDIVRYEDIYGRI